MKRPKRSKPVLWVVEQNDLAYGWVPSRTVSLDLAVYESMADALRGIRNGQAAELRRGRTRLRAYVRRSK